MAMQPSWLPQLQEIIQQARALIARYDNPDLTGDKGPYTHTDDLRSCDIGGLSLEEWGKENVAYHLVISAEASDDEVGLDMPLLEIKIRPQRLWLDKLKELSAQVQPAKKAKPAAAH